MEIRDSTNTKDYPVIIIGAGLAGLGAGYLLQKQGVKAVILEAGEEVGGRTVNEEVGGHVMPYGAEFFTPQYTEILKACDELGIELVRAGGEKYVVSYAGQKSLFGHLNILRLVSRFGMGNLIRGMAQLPRLIRSYSLDPAELKGLTSTIPQDLEQFLRQSKLPERLVRLVQVISRMTFHYANGLEELNTGFIVNWVKHVVAGKYLVPKGGIVEFAERLSQKINFEVGTTVVNAERNGDGWTLYTQAGQKYICQFLVLATPAQAALEIIGEAHIGGDSKVVYDLLNQTEYSKLTRLYFQTNSRFLEQGVVEIFADDNFPLEFVSQPKDDLLVCKVRPQSSAGVNELLDSEGCLKPWMPEKKLKLLVQDHLQVALPHYNTAHIKRVVEFLQIQDQVLRTEKYTFAGDYIDGPYTEAAFRSGLRAAELIAQIMPQHKVNGRRS